MTTDVVIDASAAVEMVTRTTTGAQLQLLLPPHPVPWIPDGHFDAEVISVLRRSVQSKFVRRGRGGYCFEHGTLFAAALDAY